MSNNETHPTDASSVAEVSYKLGDCYELIKDLPDNSVDLILTDPPYGINKEGVIGDDSLDTFKNIQDELYRVLKTDRWAVFFVPNGRLPEVLEFMPFDYVWSCMVFYSNMQRVNHIPIGRCMTSMYIVFKKGNPKTNRKIWDIQKYVYRGEDIVKHPSPKPIVVCERIVTAFSKPNDMVFDPFLGSGTTLMACRNTGRNGLGYEINEEYEQVIKERIKESVPELMKYDSLPQGRGGVGNERSE